MTPYPPKNSKDWVLGSYSRIRSAVELKPFVRALVLSWYFGLLQQCIGMSVSLIGLSKLNDLNGCVGKHVEYIHRLLLDNSSRYTPAFW